MLCWGKAKDGQLGIGVERNPMFEPRNCNVFTGRGLKEIVCGGQHSVFLLHDGSVYTCGSNSCGQLGHNKPGITPGRVVMSLTPTACLLYYLKDVFWPFPCCLWIVLLFKIFLLLPEYVGALDTQKITRVSCGQAHSLAVNEQGQVFAWGAGEGGQLGLGTTETAVRIPR